MDQAAMERKGKLQKINEELMQKMIQKSVII